MSMIEEKVRDSNEKIAACAQATMETEESH
jgi:hypothetical protein